MSLDEKNGKDKCDFRSTICSNRLMKKILQKKHAILLVFLIFLVAGAAFFAYSKFVPEKKIHYHAGLLVFQNNKKVDFSDVKYMYIKPCTINGKEEETNEDDQLEKAHLHDNIGDVIHIERGGAVWKDLFTNIRFPLDYDKATGFINGKKVVNYQSKVIQPYDRLIVFIGKNDMTSGLRLAPTKDYIEKTAKKSKTCGD